MIGDALSGVRVGEVMSADPVTAPAGMSVAEFVDRHLWQARHSAFPLVEDGRPTGLVTLGRIRTVDPAQRAGTPLLAVACPMDELATATPDEPVSEVLPRLNRCGEHRALVVSEGRLVGILTPTDISRAVQHAALRPHAGARPAAPVSVWKPPTR